MLLQKYLVEYEDGTFYQTRELRPRRREENSIIALRRSRNSTKTISYTEDDDDDDEYNEKVKTIWFSLIASENQ